MILIARLTAALLISAQAPNPSLKLRNEIPITKSDKVIAITAENFGLGARETKKLILALWEDGRIVWSRDKLNGGPPYYTALLPPDTLDSLLSKWEIAGIFSDKSVQGGDMWIDFRQTHIFIKSEAKTYSSRSVYEIQKQW